jgi:radical SAM superfamily enzyme
MDQKPRCQSCGMPVSPGYYGTEADGKVNPEYCMFCYKSGAFTEPNLTLEGMIDKSVRHMTESMGFEKEKAAEMSRAVIPTLRRWTKAS